MIRYLSCTLSIDALDPSDALGNVVSIDNAPVTTALFRPMTLTFAQLWSGHRCPPC